MSLILTLLAVGSVVLAGFLLFGFFADAFVDCAAGFDMRDWKKRLRNEAATDAGWSFADLDFDGDGD